VRARNIVVCALAAALTGAGCGTAAEGTASRDAGASADTALSCTKPATARSTSAVKPIMTPHPSLPVTYADITGKPVTITDASRILALDSYGTLATTVYALGLGDRLVGRDVSTGVPELMHLPLVTHNGHELNAEAIFALRPSVVLTDYSIGPLEVQLQLKDAGIPVVIMSDQRARALIGPQIEAVATVLGVPAAGRELAARVETETKAAEAQVAKLVPRDAKARLRMVFLYIRGKAGVYHWFGKGSGADDLIDELGGIDVATETGLEGSRPLTAEGLVKAEPDLFLMMSHGLSSVGGVRGLLDVPGVAETTAGINSCVVDMSDYQILSYGPQFPATLSALATAIYEHAAPS
jgi:iron complex transport system substrate-binding protein